MFEPRPTSTYGPSPVGLAGITAPPDLTTAPEPHSASLRHALADRYSLPPEAFVVGADTAILLHHLVARAAASGGGETVYSEPSCHLYRSLTVDYGLIGRAVPLRDYRHDLSGLVGAVSGRTRIVLVDSPHNITGATTPLSDLVALAQVVPDRAVVMLDNVYGEFQDDDEFDRWFRDLVERRVPIIVCRSLSKTRRLFGRRAGYMIGAPAVLGALGPILLHYDIGTLTQVAAQASLAGHATFEANRHVVIEGRQRLAAVLDEAGIPFAPSESTSILLDAGPAASQLAYRLSSAGCGLRSPSTGGVPAGHIQLFIDSADTPARVARVLAEWQEPQ
ncbi:aminotransferase class I/II-fold pyridoxal phosphate-dependent enzyme [Salinispora arenicola]|uniref:aminotransferase class I/II-fold pyridoxal phosphate-dependent enzyme n=1 Tax=Salinispora arenicola TaxID=168697 RepID=UPI000369098C|nr:aminotransferase class I/II-fold pyridoxal phosphate-dependent enzyme [Salinispora arenicola]